MSGYYNDHKAFSPIRANSLLMELLHYFFSHICKKNEVFLDRQVASTKKIDALLTYMEQNLHRKLQMDDFADVMNLNPNYLIRLFKTTFGTSPMDYFNRMRIEKKAKELLKLDFDSISSISDKLGFNTPYYFSYVLKAYCYSPKDYRKKMT